VHTTEPTRCIRKTRCIQQNRRRACDGTDAVRAQPSAWSLPEHSPRSGRLLVAQGGDERRAQHDANGTLGTHTTRAEPAERAALAAQYARDESRPLRGLTRDFIPFPGFHSQCAARTAHLHPGLPKAARSAGCARAGSRLESARAGSTVEGAHTGSRVESARAGSRVEGAHARGGCA
jgi:hypothetical protein